MKSRTRLDVVEVVYERDEAGWWVASVPAVQGVHTQARSIAGARRRVREALAVGDAVAGRVSFSERIVPPAGVARLQTALEAAQQKSQAAAERAGALERLFVSTCAKRHLSRRDTAELLGRSHQRVQRLTSARP